MKTTVIDLYRIGDSTDAGLYAVRLGIDIERALAAQDGAVDHKEFRSWVSHSDAELPSHVAQIALHALSGLALQIERQISDENLSAKDAALLENDLGYISDIEIVLSGLLSPPHQVAYG